MGNLPYLTDSLPLLTGILQDWAAPCQPARAKHPHCLEGKSPHHQHSILLMKEVVVVLRACLYFLNHRTESEHCNIPVTNLRQEESTRHNMDRHRSNDWVCDILLLPHHLPVFASHVFLDAVPRSRR